MSRWRSRRARAGFWCAVGVIACLLLATIASLWWTIERKDLTGGSRIAVAAGSLHIARFRITFFTSSGSPGSAWVVERTDGPPQLWFEHQSVPGPLSYTRIPLWIPLVLLAAATTYLWFRGRGFGPGRCAACGYDLRNNVSAICPECGKDRKTSNDPHERAAPKPTDPRA